MCSIHPHPYPPYPMGTRFYPIIYPWVKIYFIHVFLSGKNCRVLSFEYQLPSSDGSHDENAGAVIVRGEGRPSDDLGLEQRGESGEGKPNTTRSVMGLANR